MKTKRKRIPAAKRLFGVYTSIEPDGYWLSAKYHAGNGRVCGLTVGRKADNGFPDVYYCKANTCKQVGDFIVNSLLVTSTLYYNKQMGRLDLRAQKYARKSIGTQNGVKPSESVAKLGPQT